MGIGLSAVSQAAARQARSLYDDHGKRWATIAKQLRRQGGAGKAAANDRDVVFLSRRVAPGLHAGPLPRHNTIMSIVIVDFYRDRGAPGGTPVSPSPVSPSEQQCGN